MFNRKKTFRNQYKYLFFGFKQVQNLVIHLIWEYLQFINQDWE